MQPSIGNILVSVNLDQKEDATIGGNVLKTGKAYNENFRERNPVIAFVKNGNKDIQTGRYIVCNYSHFDLESPHELYEGIYSIPVDSEIFATINDDGSLNPVMGNVLVERITKDSYLPLPEELKKPYTNRGVLLTPTSEIPSGSYIFWLTMADYQICYTWEGVEKTALKVHQSEITGYLK